MNKKNHLLEGPILKSIIFLSLPIIFANILQTAYQLTDTFWLGRLGTNAVAAVSLSFPLIFLLISVASGLGIAGTVLVAQYKGKDDRKAVNHISAQTLLMVLVISVILSILGYFLAPLLVRLMGADAVVVLAAISYIKISFIGMIFVFVYTIFQSLMRGVGDVKTPIFIVLATVLLNLILDPLFIFGYSFLPAFGVSGAAMATVVTQSLAAFAGVFILLRGKHKIHLHISDFKVDFKLLKRIFKLALPASFGQSTRALGMMVMTFLVTSFGTLTLAAYGIGGRILSFIIIPALGISMATTTLVGQNIGAGKIDRAEKITKLSALLGFVFLTFVGIIIFFLAEKLAAVFIPGELDTIKSSALFIRIMSLTFGFIGIQMALSGAFRASGNTAISMILSVISLWILRFPLAYILSNHTGLLEVGIWIAFPVANVSAAIIAMIWFAQGTWKKKDLLEEVAGRDD